MALLQTVGIAHYSNYTCSREDTVVSFPDFYHEGRYCSTFDSAKHRRGILSVEELMFYCRE